MVLIVAVNCLVPVSSTCAFLCFISTDSVGTNCWFYFVIKYVSTFNIFLTLNCYLDKTRHLNMLAWDLGDCDGYFETKLV